MKTILITLLITALTLVHTVSAEDRDAKEIKRIGIYDSRAITVAFVGSEVYKATAGKEKAELEARNARLQFAKGL